MYGRRVIDMLSGAENQTVSAASADNCTTSDGFVSISSNPTTSLLDFWQLMAARLV